MVGVTQQEGNIRDAESFIIQVLQGQLMPKVLQYLTKLGTALRQSALEGAARNILDFSRPVYGDTAGRQEPYQGSTQFSQYRVGLIVGKPMPGRVADRLTPICIQLDQGVIQTLSIKIEATHRLIKIQLFSEHLFQ